MSSLVSIIIPTFNRSHLIGQTLDSIIRQSYKNWECLVIDDRSLDYTDELMDFYCHRDSRIKYFQRPANRPSGGNAARNYGFEKSKGKFIQWFDSDDLMVPVFLERKMKLIEEGRLDYVISKTANFEDPDPLKIINRNANYYQFDEYEITHLNYAVQNINWLTYDFLGKRDLCDKVRFNEKLLSAQERNFFCKISYYSNKAAVIDEFLTLRRKHSQSKRAKLKKSQRLKNRDKFAFFFYTWKDLKLLNSPLAKFHFNEAVKLNPQTFLQIFLLFELVWEFIRRKKIKAAGFLMLYNISKKLSGKGFQLRKYFIEEDAYIFK